MKLEDGLQRSLAHLGLIWRVRRVELRSLEDLIDNRRNEMRVGAGADEAVLLGGDILCRQRLQARPDLGLRNPRGEMERRAGA